MNSSWHLRYEQHGDGSWTYHAAGVGFIAACGSPDTEPAGADEYDEALHTFMGRGSPDASWCPACAAAVAERWADTRVRDA